MGALSRNKGASAERDVVTLLVASGLYPDARRRASGEETLDGRGGMEDQGRDLKGTPGLCVQVQFSKRPAPLKKFREACDAARPATGERSAEMPVAFVRENRGDWVVVLRATDLLALMAAARGTRRVGEGG